MSAPRTRRVGRGVRRARPPKPAKLALPHRARRGFAAAATTLSSASGLWFSGAPSAPVFADARSPPAPMMRSHANANEARRTGARQDSTRRGNVVLKTDDLPSHPSEWRENGRGEVLFEDVHDEWLDCPIARPIRLPSTCTRPQARRSPRSRSWKRHLPKDRFRPPPGSIARGECRSHPRLRVRRRLPLRPAPPARSSTTPARPFPASGADSLYTRDVIPSARPGYRRRSLPPPRWWLTRRLARVPSGAFTTEPAS